MYTAQQHHQPQTQQALQHLQQLQGAPSVHMHEVPPDFVLGPELDVDEHYDPDVRPTVSLTSSGAERREPANELYDGDKDQDS
jgi:hypothetical protein